MIILKYILIVIDKILNPKATDYPFVYCDKVEEYDYSSLKRYLIIREFDEGNKHWLWCIRWL